MIRIYYYVINLHYLIVLSQTFKKIVLRIIRSIYKGYVWYISYLQRKIALLFNHHKMKKRYFLILQLTLLLIIQYVVSIYVVHGLHQILIK